ncbi:MAG: GGDEF domain-containing protein [Thermosipho sp. (in: Bacteria)]|nr:GGDEF domain-containing protein [Thermosipho sp. (in: thermotogales)]
MKLKVEEYCDLLTSKIVLETAIEVLRKGNISEFFERLAERLRFYLNFDGWSVINLIKNKPHFVAFSKGYRNLDLKKIAEKMSDKEIFLYMQVLNSGRWKYIKNLEKKSIWITREEIVHSWIGIPLIFRDSEAYSILNLDYYTPKKLTSKDEKFLDHFQRNFAKYAIKFLDIKELSEQKYIDPLTGLKNRYYLEKLIEDSKKNEKLVLIFCDLDGFKKINDKCGHAFGDNVLKIVGKRLRNIVKSTDEVIRYGGDEFVVVTNDVNSAWKIIERINQFISERDIFLDERRIKIGISCGYAIYPDESDNLREILHISDMRMYKNKEKNHNNKK